MTMVDDAATGPAPGRPPGPVDRAPDAVVIRCAARPGSGLAHLDGPCQCFFGGPPPVYRDVLERLPRGA